jgi:FAD/FMN-containing dehydrogenase
MAEWSNWSGRQTSVPARIVGPSTETEIVDAVRSAAADGLAIRAVGASHSHSRVAATDGLLMAMDGWQGVVSADPDALEATIRAGTRIFQLGEPLHAAGLALRNQGDIDKQSVSGATATGTHGTGPTLQNLSASVCGVRIVLASGDVVDCDASTEPGLFEVARHSVGGVGLVTELRLTLRPAYRLHEQTWFEPPGTVFGRIDQLMSATRHFEFFWMPQNDTCACKSLAEIDGEIPASDMAEAHPGDAQADAPALSGLHERSGWSHEIISSIRDVKHTEMEYSVPADAGPACFEELRQMILSDFADLQWPLEYRTLAADDIWISTASERDTVTISAHQDIALDDEPLFAACEAVFTRHAGRPHWGKAHSRTGAQLAEMYPRYRDWWAERDRYDPEGVFVTPDLALLRP